MSSRYNNLKRIGEEGFRMLDQATEEKQRCLYHPTKPSVNYLQPPPVTHVQRIVTPPPQINYSQHHIQTSSYTLHQTMAKPVSENTTSNSYNQPRRSADHMAHVTQVTTRDQASTSVMDCYEAARRFGGMVVTDYYPNKKKVMMQRGSKAF